MTGFDAITEQLQISLDKVFIPTLLKMILPYMIAILVFGIIRIISAKIFRNQRTLRICMDLVIVLAFLVVCGLVLVPVTSHFISSGDIFGGEISVPEFSGSDPFSDISMPEFSGSDPLSDISMPEFSGSDPFQIGSSSQG